ncbi:MAG TPA: MBL fold metallo-hydrolase [Xanthobacteraceae bacterium]|jgi:glyoxylase-like metal-dependent hydrolase (beta-lactamase superfamily II)|nr:MBL fold metallo-hydrolase [Xanthobacteraceae bacterium]
MAAPFANSQSPGFYRHKVGDYEITIVNDGGLALPAGVYSGDPAGAEKLLNDAHLDKDNIPTHVNTWLINTGSRLVLVDTGGGTGFAPTLGRLPKNLAAAGVDPNAIDTVVLTHMHPDHIPGLLAADGKMMFESAVVHVNGDEYAFWTSDEIRGKAPDEFKGFFDMARAAIKPYADAGKVMMHKDGTQFAPGVTAAAAPGHTVGHTMVRVSSAGDDLLIWGDIVHTAALQFPEPERSVGFDNNPELAIANRKKVFDMVATDRLLFTGAHLPFPALGRATKAASGGYVYVPVHYAEYP